MKTAIYVYRNAFGWLSFSTNKQRSTDYKFLGSFEVDIDLPAEIVRREVEAERWNGALVALKNGCSMPDDAKNVKVSYDIEVRK